MDQGNPDIRQGVDALLETHTDAQERVKRRQLQEELIDIEARVAADDATRRKYQATIEQHQISLRILRDQIASQENAIRALDQQTSRTRARREVIIRDLGAGSTLRNQVRHQVRLEFFAALRSQSFDPFSYNVTEDAQDTGSSSDPKPQESGRLEETPEAPEKQDGPQEEQRVRRSARTRHHRRYNESAQSSPEPDAPKGGSSEAHRGNKRRKTTGSSLASDPRDPVEFDEVYADGKAVVKYNITEYPKGSNNWYILRCLEHNKHFYRTALQAGSKHLSGRAHGLTRSQQIAFQMLSVRVLNCDAEKARLNNLAVKEAVDAGYPYRTPEMAGDGQRRSSFEFEDGDRLHSSRGTEHAVGPNVGQIYGATWLEKPAIVVVLPIGDLSVVGMTGPRITSLVKPPACYRFSKTDRAYIWNYHYQDRSTRVASRKYPVMAFQGDMVIPSYPEPFRLPLRRKCYGFFKPSQLRCIDLDDPEHGQTEGLAAAKAFQARVAAVRGGPEAASRPDGPRVHATAQDDHSNTQGNDDHGEDDPGTDDDLDDDFWYNMDNILDDSDDYSTDTELGNGDGDDDDATIEAPNTRGGGAAVENNRDGTGSHHRPGESGDHAHPGGAHEVHHSPESCLAGVDSSALAASTENTILVGGAHAAGDMLPPEVPDSPERAEEASGGAATAAAEPSEPSLEMRGGPGSGQDHVSADQESELQGTTLSTAQPYLDTATLPGRNPHGQVKAEAPCHSFFCNSSTCSQHPTSSLGAQGQPAVMDVAHGLPVVEHIDLTCPDSPSPPSSSGHNRASSQFMREQQGPSSAYRFAFSSPSQGQTGHLPPVSEHWRSVSFAGPTFFEAGHAASGTRSSMGPPSGTWHTTATFAASTTASRDTAEHVRSHQASGQRHT